MPSRAPAAPPRAIIATVPPGVRAWRAAAAIALASACAPDTSGLGSESTAAVDPTDPSTSTSGEPPADTAADAATTGTTILGDDTAAASSSGDGPSSESSTTSAGDTTDTGTGPLELERCVMPNVPIPDNDASGVSSVIDVPEVGTIVGLRVLVQATHSFIGDLRIVLIANAGQAALVDRPDDADQVSDGNCGGVNIDAALHDAASATVDGVCMDGANPGLFGEVRPDEPLDPVFVGEPMAGSWRLHVVDAANDDSGTLQSWCLQVTYR